MKFFISLLVVGCLFTGCKEYGTEGGNPENPGDPNGGINSPIASTSQTLANTLCEKRQACTGITDASCLNLVATHPSITSELNMSSRYSDLQELSSADANLIQIDSIKANECNQSIHDIDCTSSLGIDAFDPATYQDINLALRASASCAEIYSEKTN
jgi:hypothetical protein